MASVALAELLLRRKELEARVSLMRTINKKELFETRVQRVQVTEGLDEVTAALPRLTYGEFQAELNEYERKLRQTDAFIQRTNWETQVECGDVMNDYVAPISE